MNFKIERLDHQGRGISTLDGKITFIPYTLPEEVVDAELIAIHPKYNIAKLNKVLVHSPKRVNEDCPFFKSCGGCQLRHLNYEDTLTFKKEKLSNILTLNKIVYPPIEVIPNEKPNNYRNKITLKIVAGKIGFYEEKSHELSEIDTCLLAKPVLNVALKKLSSLSITNGEVILRANYNDEILMIIKTKDKINWDIKNFANLKLIGVILNNKVIYGTSFFYERTLNTLFKVSYDAFFQVNYDVAKKLMAIIKDNVKENEKVLDLYSGVGTLSLMASKNAHAVYSIEYVKNAVLDAIKNAKLNNQDNIKCFLGKTKDVIKKINENFDRIIIDPPRKGIDSATLEVILKSNCPNLLYVSCEPLTLARDLKLLSTKYEITKLYLLDMFSYTANVECVCVLKAR